MGQTWAKNLLFYPKLCTDEEMRDIPFPRTELYDHVATKWCQVGTVGGLVIGSGVALLRKRNVMSTALKYGRNGIIVGLVMTPIMTEGILYQTKSGPEEVYDRVYRIRYNRSQTRSAQWSTYIPAVTMAAGAYMAKPPVTRLMGCVNGLVVGLAGATIASAVLPQQEKEKPPKKEENQAAPAS